MLVGAILLVAISIGSGPAPSSPDPGVIATFEGETLNLSEGWGEAQACYSDNDGTRCYRSEMEMDAEESLAPSGWRRVEVVCASTLRLYSGGSFGGSVLALNQRGVVIGLSSYGFSNVTSSYKVGACSSTFYDGAGGSAVYPGNTSAGASATSMVAGWDNRVSSVYIS